MINLMSNVIGIQFLFGIKKSEKIIGAMLLGLFVTLVAL